MIVGQNLEGKVRHKVTAKDQVDGGKSQQLRFVGDILDESNGPQLPELYT